MSNYSKIVNYATKDALSSGDPLKKVSGTELDAEFTAIQTAVSTKSDIIVASGSFTATLTGCTAGVTGTVNYKVVGSVCSLYVPVSISGTSNTFTFTFTGLPVAATPSSNVSCQVYGILIGSGTYSGVANIQTSGTVQFLLGVVSGTNLIADASSFPVTGVKGLNGGMSIMYPL